MRPGHLRHILEFWRAAEHLACFTIPKAGRRSNAGDATFGIDDRSLLPWSADHPIRRGHPASAQRWSFVVYLGVFQLEGIREYIESVVGKLPVGFDEKLDGESAIASFEVSSSGRFVPESFELSPFAFALGKLLSSYPRVLDIYDGLQKAVQQERQVLQQICGTEQGHSREIGSGDLIGMSARLTRTLRWPPVAFKSLATVVVRMREDENAPEDRVKLTSACLDTLNLLVREPADATSGLLGALARGDPENDDERTDLSQSPAYVVQAVSPSRSTRTSWPRDDGSMPTFSETFASCFITSTNDRATNVLSLTVPSQATRVVIMRDLAAHLLAGRAAVLSSFSQAADIFRSEVILQDGRRVRLLDPRACGHELVVVCSDTPSAQLLSGQFSAPADAGLPRDARAPRSAVISRNSLSYVFSTGKHRFDERPLSLSRAAMKAAGSARALSASSWRDACGKFRKMWDDVERHRQEPERISRALSSRNERKKEIEGLRKEAETVLARMREVKAVLASQEEALRSTEAALSNAEKQLEAIRNRIPKALRLLASFSARWSSWGAETREAERVIEEKRAAVQAAQELVLDTSSKLNHLRLELKALRGRLEEQRRQWINDSMSIEASKERVGFFCCDSDSMRLTREELDKETPWIDGAHQRVREELCAEAFRLHTALVDEIGPQLLENASVAIDLMEGRVAEALPAEVFQSAFSALSLLVPVLLIGAEHFESAFACAGTRSVGWCVIDNSGSLTPQASLPMFAKCEHVVALGHPYTTRRRHRNALPSLTEFLRQQAGIPSALAGAHVSLQALIDRFTLIGQRSKDSWLSPVIWTQRDIGPEQVAMLNEMAFGGALVSRLSADSGAALPLSAWYDVDQQTSKGHFIPEEADVVDSLLYALGEQRWCTRIVTPFPDVAAALRKRFYEADVGEFIFTLSEAPEEAEEITILVLGGDPRSEVAFEWVSERPDLVVGALSATARRLYVVGNHARWSSRPYVSVVARALPVKTTQERPRTVRFSTEGTALLFPASGDEPPLSRPRSAG